MATLTRLLGDLDRAEEALQEASAVAVVRWPVEGIPDRPGAWLVSVARHKAIDAIRREARRPEKEAAATRSWDREEPGPAPALGPLPDDQLGLIFLCCHPALDPDVRVPLTLRAVCGLTTAEIAAGFLVPEPTMAKRLVRAKEKIRRAGMPFRTPGPVEIGERLGDVLRVISLVFSEGHYSSRGETLVRAELCEAAVGLARSLVVLLPGEPEALGLLALLLLTDARRPARTGRAGQVVLLEDQDRSRWDGSLLAEGEELVERALRMGRPGSFQLQAAIAACHGTAATAGDTDWPQIALLYRELLRYDPSPVVEANRAVAVGMADGPEAGLAAIEEVAGHPQLARWPRLEIARAELLRRAGRDGDAVAAYGRALDLGPSPAERDFAERRMEELRARWAPPSMSL